MGRKKENINPVCGRNLKVLLSDNKMTQKRLAEELGYTEQHISLIIKGTRRMTEETARKIVALFPGTRYEWLMGYDGFRTEMEKALSSAVDELKLVAINRDFIKALLFENGFELQQFGGLFKYGERAPIKRLNGEVVSSISEVEYTALIKELWQYGSYLIQKHIAGEAGYNHSLLDAWEKAERFYYKNGGTDEDENNVHTPLTYEEAYKIYERGDGKRDG